MLKEHIHKKIVWTDLLNPTPQELERVATIHDIHPLVEKEMASPTSKARLEIHPHFVFAIFHFPALKHTHKDERNQEIDFVIGQNFIVTVRYDTVDALDELSKMFEIQSVKERSVIGKHGGDLFLHMIRGLYASVRQELDIIRTSLRYLERDMFANHEREMLEKLTRISSDLLTLKEGLSFHRDIFDSFSLGGKQIFDRDESFGIKLGAVIEEFEKTRRSIIHTREYLDELRKTNDSLLNTKQNETMKILTVTALFFAPLTTVAAIFTLNAHHIPFIGHQNDFWIVLGLMFGSSALLLGYFKYKKWI